MEKGRRKDREIGGDNMGLVSAHEEALTNSFKWKPLCFVFTFVVKTYRPVEWCDMGHTHPLSLSDLELFINIFLWVNREILKPCMSDMREVF